MSYCVIVIVWKTGSTVAGGECGVGAKREALHQHGRPVSRTTRRVPKQWRHGSKELRVGVVRKIVAVDGFVNGLWRAAM